MATKSRTSTKKKKIVIYHSKFADIGGTITFTINFCKTFYKQYDITVVGDMKKDDRWIGLLSNYAEVIVPLTSPIDCDILIINRMDSNPDTVKKINAKKSYHMIHCDMNAMTNLGSCYKLKFPDLDYISVSPTAQKGLKDICHKDSIVIPNIVIPAKRKKILRLITAMRISREKGYDNMVKLAKLFKEHNIPYSWDLYCDKPEKADHTLFNVKPAENDISQYFTNYDYVVQLSLSESFSYVLYEALMQGVPVIATCFPNAKQDIQDGVNGYIVGFNLEGVDVDKIYDNIPHPKKTTQEQVKGQWEKIIESL